MPKKKVEIDNTIKEKIDYLKIKSIPKNISQIHNLKFKVLKGYDERQYKQYRFINVEDIDILLTPANRLDDLKDKYEKARPLYMYLNSSDEENAERHLTFLNMIRKVEISDIEKVEKEQEQLQKMLPFKVKFNGNYLWQIYYSEYTKKYFMLVPTEDSDYSTFFYLLKKKIEGKTGEKVFVPVSYVDYSGEILKKSELRDIENYLWAFTKDYPSIYEVFDKKGQISLQIVGETELYGKIKTWYKIAFSNAKDATKFYKLLKALFILQTEIPRYYKFTTNISEKGILQIYLDSSKIEYETLPEFVLGQYIKSASLKEKINDEIDALTEKLENLKQEEKLLESEYVTKEKQISTYLECKKTFLGKMKYYFKFGKKSTKPKKENLEDIILKEEKLRGEKDSKNKIKLENRNYTLDELVMSFKEVEILENNEKNTILDINAKKLKNKNLKKKIENATAYINEINKHKKSIFEFWKYSNKDEVAALEEGEQEELNITKLEKTFNYDDDFEKFGEAIDKSQRMKLTDAELDSIFVATTNLIGLINRTYKKEAEPKEFSEAIKYLKDHQFDEEESENDEGEDFNIFGKLSSDKTKESNLGNKTHRETARDIYQILDIRKGKKGVELKKDIVEVVKNIKKALKKNVLDEDIYAYKALPYEIDMNEILPLSLNEESELDECLQNDRIRNKIYLYKIKLPKGTNFSAFSNIIYYNNKNMTLPVGMNLSNKILVDMKSLDLKQSYSIELRKTDFQNSKSDFSKVMVRNLNIIELKV